MAASGRDPAWQVSISAPDFTLEPCKYWGGGVAGWEGVCVKWRHISQHLWFSPRKSCLHQGKHLGQRPIVHPALETVPGFGDPCGLPMCGWKGRKHRWWEQSRAKEEGARARPCGRNEEGSGARGSCPKDSRGCRGFGEVWLCHTSRGFFLLFPLVLAWVFRGSSKQRTSWVSHTRGKEDVGVGAPGSPLTICEQQHSFIHRHGGTWDPEK